MLKSLTVELLSNHLAIFTFVNERNSKCTIFDFICSVWKFYINNFGVNAINVIWLCQWTVINRAFVRHSAWWNRPTIPSTAAISHPKTIPKIVRANRNIELVLCSATKIQIDA